MDFLFWHLGFLLDKMTSGLMKVFNFNKWLNRISFPLSKVKGEYSCYSKSTSLTEPYLMVQIDNLKLICHYFYWGNNDNSWMSWALALCQVRCQVIYMGPLLGYSKHSDEESIMLPWCKGSWSPEMCPWQVSHLNNYPPGPLQTLQEKREVLWHITF